jgi:UDP-glucose 4-epimerase
MTTFLVTGGAGFIGSHLVEALLKQGHTVRVVDNFSTGKQANLAQFINDIELHKISITDFDALSVAMKGVDYVFHEAAIASVPRSIDDPKTCHDVNVTGTFNVLCTARDAGVKRVVYAASSSAYGDIEGEYKREDMPPRPLSPYGAAKLAAEHYMKVFYEVYGLETVSLRYFNVFGPRQDPNSEYAAVIPKFALRMMIDESPIIYGDGLQSRDFTFIDNIVHGNLLAITSPKAAGQMFNLACGGRYSLLDVVKILNSHMSKDIEPIFEPSRTGDIKHSRADINKAGELLGYEPIITFEEGISRTVDWFAKQPSQ